MSEQINFIDSCFVVTFISIVSILQLLLSLKPVAFHEEREVVAVPTVLAQEVRLTDGEADVQGHGKSKT